MTDVLTPSSGIRSQRIEFIRENTYGVTPSDPKWNKFSDDVTSYEPTMDAAVEPVRSMGNALPTDHASGLENHELNIAYRIQRDFEDGSDNPQDASADGMERDSNNMIKNSHTVVKRETRVDGSGNDYRVYTVGKGGLIDTVEIPGDIGDSDYIIITLSYMFKKLRSYKIQQPSSSTKLAIESTDSNDTSQSLEIENEGAGTTESVSLNGTTVVSSSSSFSDIDVLELDSEAIGDVKIYENDGTETSPTKGTQLATIKGSASYDDVQGDLGIPALGSSGSHAADVGTDFFRFANTTVERPASTDLAAQINSVSLTIENNIEADGDVGSTLPQLVPGPQDVTLTATIWGYQEAHNKVVDHLTTSKDNLIWNLGSSPGQIELTNATIIDPGTLAEESEQAFATVDSQFSAEDLKVTQP